MSSDPHDVPGSAAEVDPYQHKWRVLAAVCVALFMVLLDSSIVNVAVPQISKQLNASFAQLEWVLNAYTLVFASLLVTFGRLGDMFGRKRYFVVGLAVFGTGSLLCGLAATPALLIGARVVQAFGAAFMMPATLSLTAVNFPPEQRGMAMGIWGAVSGLATAIGPALGGYITEAFSWHYIFFINIPVVLFAIPFAIRSIPESFDARPHKIDVAGALMSIVVLASLSYALIEGPTVGWTTRELFGGALSPLMLFGVAAAVLVAFLLWERKAAEPIVDLALFKSVGFSAGNAAGAIMTFGMMGIIFMLPLYLQAQVGYSAMAAGFTLTPLSGAIMLTAPLSGRLSDRFGSRWLVFAGILVMSGAAFWFSFVSRGDGWTWLLAPLLMAGIGMGLVMAPMTSAVMAHAPRGEEGAASGLLSTIRQIGGVMGIAVLGAVFQTAMVSGMVAGVGDVPQLPKAAVPHVRALIEDGGSGGMLGGLDAAKMRAAIPPKVMLPLVEDAVRDAAADELPIAWRDRVSASVLSAVEGGADLTDREALQEIVAGASAARPLSAPPGTVMHGAGVPGTVMPRPSMGQFTAFGTRLGENMRAKYAEMGEGFADVAADAFVAALRRTFRVAAAVLLFGAFLALLLRPGKNHYIDTDEPVVVAAH